MSDGTRHHRHEAKTPVFRLKEDESDKEREVEHFAKMVEEMVTHCMEAVSYDPQLVKQRMRELVEGFVDRQAERKKTPAPINPHANIFNGNYLVEN